MKQESNFFHTLFRLLKLIHQQDRSVIPLTIIGAMLEALEPFILLIGGALVLDSLLLSAWDQAMIQAMFMLGIYFINGLFLDFIRCNIETAGMSINRLCNGSVCLKAISLDYQTFADKKNLEEFDAADYNVSNNGGFGILILEFRNLIRGATGCIASGILLLQLCLEQVTRDTPLSFLVTRNASIVIIALLLSSLCFIYRKLSHYVNKHQINLYYENVELNQRLSYLTFQLNTNAEFAKEIRMYHLKGLLLQAWKQMASKRYSFKVKEWKYETFSLLFSSILNDIILLLAYLFVILKVVAGAATIGSFTRYVGAIQQTNMSLKTVVEAMGKLQVIQSYLKFYLNFLDKENNMDTGSLPVEKRNDNEYELEFHNVSFRYPGSSTDSLRNVSIKLDLKHKYAVVGKNGAGKTTFVKLLCRLYDVSEGCITLNGVDIRKYEYQEYMNLFAAVFQDFSLFAFPVKENITCGKSYDEAFLWQCAKQSGIDERIQCMEHQMEELLFHEMGQGVCLSGGEEQKLAITRALYKDSPVVILDEPTAALDPISEYEIYSRFDEMVKDKTSIYISHRMSSCRFCDQILVFDEGLLKQTGTHDELMTEQDQIYAKLWNAQAKYYAKNQLL